jgi:mannose-6-phosphate isomerase-like protein (cupin superfamily)
MAKPLDKVIFNADDVKEIESPFSKGILFKPFLHPNRQDGSAIDLKNGAPAIRHSTAQFTIKPGYSWPKTVFTISELYYITEGNGEIEISGTTHPVKKGDVIYVAPHLERAIRNNGESDLIYLSITDPEWSPETESQ